MKHKYSEFVAAEAGEHATSIEDLIHARSGLNDQLVANSMTKGVVDGLKTVEINEPDDNAGVRGGGCEALVKPSGEEIAVGKAGQHVLESKFPRVLLASTQLFPASIKTSYQ
jgi:hypothetical protein